MDNIISLIERLGADSKLRYGTKSAFDETSLVLSEAETLISQGNIEELEMLLNVRHKIVCMVFPVEEPKDQPNQPAEDDEPGDVKVRVAV
ncbi:hypothetical protein [Rheinheimera pacifica]|uniref:hypothetical protein n=1 Tax=Rheinheimera pacifica TaxID=173990 RepID=UPI002EDA4E9E